MELRGQWGHSVANKIRWIRSYALIFKKIKLCTKLVARQYMNVFTSKFICNNLYLLFVVIFIICLQSSTKLFFITGTSHWMTGSSVKSITGVTFVGKCPWLVCLTYCLHFCRWLQHFLMSLLVFSNSKILIVLIPS